MSNFELLSTYVELICQLEKRILKKFMKFIVHSCGKHCKFASFEASFADDVTLSKITPPFFS